MRPSRLALLGLLPLAAIAGVLATRDEAYRVDVQLDNAGGLRKNSDVRHGGVPVGKVVELRLAEDDTAVAEIELDDEVAPIGADARVAIRSANLLGDKFVDLELGDPSRPQPSGAVIPRARASNSVDLDELIDVLDTGTRLRLAVFIDAAGVALAGRHADFNALLAKMPGSFHESTELVREFASDNRALGRLLDRSDRIVGRVAGERRSLTRLVAAAGGAFESMAARRVELGRTIENAPGALRALRPWLAHLGRTARDLAPAADALRMSAPGLRSVLEELPRFETAAAPALASARRQAPLLTRLGREASPVVRDARPALRALARFASDSRPFGRLMDESIDNILSVPHGWARATQAQDGLGHVFRGGATLTPDVLTQPTQPPSPPGRGSRRRKSRPGGTRKHAEGRRVPTPAAPRDDPRESIERLLRGLPLGLDAQSPAPGIDRSVEQVLDFLLAP